jgi:CheY-like chemotaxis protein
MQILTNLVGNAVKFTESGSVTLEVSRLRVEASGLCHVLFRISDTGIGIPDDRLADLFQPFSQVARGYTRAYQGAGLGLAIAMRQVRLLGGAMSVSSEEGEGTEIAVTLPLGCAADERDRAERIKALAARNDLGLRVLLAEDDPVSRYAAVRMLQRLGCVVTEVDNGQSALAVLLREDVDLVLMDIQMPGMDGVQATRILRTDPAFGSKSDIPVVALTAYAGQDDANTFADAGMNMHIAKPVHLEDLVEVIVRCVSKPL